MTASMISTSRSQLIKTEFERVVEGMQCKWLAFFSKHKATDDLPHLHCTIGVLELLIDFFRCNKNRMESQSYRGRSRACCCGCSVVLAAATWALEAIFVSALGQCSWSYVKVSTHFNLCAESFEMGQKLDDQQQYMDGIFVEKLLLPIMTSLEAYNRNMREDLRRFDEVMEQFRKHTYSLRRLILCGNNSQSEDMLQIYFQVGLPYLCCTC